MNSHRNENEKGGYNVEGPVLSSKVEPSEAPPVTPEVPNSLVLIGALSALVFSVIGIIAVIYRRCICTTKKSKEQCVSFNLSLTETPFSVKT